MPTHPFLFFFGCQKQGENEKKILQNHNNELKKFMMLLCTGPFSHIMPKACKTLGTTLALSHHKE